MNYITANNLSYQTDRDQKIFSDLTFSLGREKTGLIGNNGIGKTTLIKILVEQIKPSSGVIHINCSIAYLPQDCQINSSQTVANFLPNTNIKILKYLKINHIDFDRQISSLSGGEKTKIALAKILSNQPDFIILDEPTNNLDNDSRQIIYQLIKEWKGGLLIVSHDRELLNLVDKIFEMTTKGIKTYGGNYNDYEIQKNKEISAAQKQLNTAQIMLKKAKVQAQKTKEKQQKRTNHGIKNKNKLGISKTMLDKMKDTGEATTARLIHAHDKNIASATDDVEKIKASIEQQNEIIIKLPDTKVPVGKMVLKIINLNFSYEKQNIFSNFNLSIYGPVHLLINGRNGAGKTTLAKLITNKLKAKSGEIKIGVENFIYLDQDINILDPEKTLLQNIQQIAQIDEDRAKDALAHFLFVGTDIYKKIKILSGGEKMRAALSCVLSSPTPPQLLIMDEPTNNLDINSVKKLESTLSNYLGALIIISHDQKFLEEIKIDEFVNL